MCIRQAFVVLSTSTLDQPTSLAFSQLVHSADDSNEVASGYLGDTVAMGSFNLEIYIFLNYVIRGHCQLDRLGQT